MRRQSAAACTTGAEVPNSLILPLGASGRLRRDHIGGASTAQLRAVGGTGAHVARLARRLRQLRPDLVHTNSLKAALYGGAAAKLASVPVVWHVHDRISDDYLPANAVKLVHAASRRLPSAVLANSEATLSTVPETTKIRRVVGNAIVAPETY